MWLHAMCEMVIIGICVIMETAMCEMVIMITWVIMKTMYVIMESIAGVYGRKVRGEQGLIAYFPGWYLI